MTRDYLHHKTKFSSFPSNVNLMHSRGFDINVANNPTIQAKSEAPQEQSDKKSLGLDLSKISVLAPSNPVPPAIQGKEINYNQLNLRANSYIQRQLPTNLQWQQQSKKKKLGHTYKRSPELIAIDEVLNEWNQLKDTNNEYVSNDEHKLTLLADIKAKIQAWKDSKKNAGQGSKRIAEINDLSNKIAQAELPFKNNLTLQQSLESAKQLSEEEFKAGIEDKSGQIRNDYTDLAVFSEGALIDDDGSFLGASKEAYDAKKKELEEAGEASSEADIRIAMLTARIREAHQKMQQEIVNYRRDSDPNAQVVGLFTAPEWYFKQPKVPFSKSDKEKIINRIQALSSELTGMLIVPGSILWREGTLDQAKLYNTTVALINGKKIQEMNKHTEGMDIKGYYKPRTQDLNRKLRNEEWQRGGGTTAEGDKTKNTNLESATDTTPFFELGNINFSFEICADHGANRALNALQAQGRGQVDVQILISHSAALNESEPIVKDQGISVHNDAVPDPAPSNRSLGAVRSVYQNDHQKLDLKNPQAQIKQKTDLQQQFMGIFKLPT